MKNKFKFNVFFNNDGNTLEKDIEIVLVNYIKQLLNNNCNEGSLEV